MVHRVPWLLIIGAIVVLVLVMAGCGTAIALLGHNSANSTSTTGIVPPQLPSPSPAGTPSPGQTPGSSPSPTPASTNGTTASNAGASINVPSGWTVVSNDSNGIVIMNPSGDGVVEVASGPSSPTQTAQQNKDTVTGSYKDAKDCPGSKTTPGALAGAAGIFWELCFPVSSGGRSVQAELDAFVGANSDGSVYYLVLLLTSQDNMSSFASEAVPVRQSIKWKLT
jgi:hypothetical protein